MAGQERAAEPEGKTIPPRRLAGHRALGQQQGASGSKDFSRLRRWLYKDDHEWKAGVRDTLVGVIVAVGALLLTIFATDRLDDKRAAQAIRLENLNFVRERSDHLRNTERPFNGMDLAHQNLDGLYLAGAQMWDAILSDARLNSANLRDAELLRANLTGAVLDRTDLTGADLSSATLTHVDLSNICPYGDRPPKLPEGVPLPENQNLTPCGMDE